MFDPAATDRSSRCCRQQSYRQSETDPALLVRFERPRDRQTNGGRGQWSPSPADPHSSNLDLFGHRNLASQRRNSPAASARLDYYNKPHVYSIFPPSSTPPLLRRSRSRGRRRSFVFVFISGSKAHRAPERRPERCWPIRHEAARRRCASARPSFGAGDSESEGGVRLLLLERRRRWR